MLMLSTLQYDCDHRGSVEAVTPSPSCPVPAGAPPASLSCGPPHPAGCPSPCPEPRWTSAGWTPSPCAQSPGCSARLADAAQIGVATVTPIVHH